MPFVHRVKLRGAVCRGPRSKRLIVEGELVSAVRLSGKLSGDFGFTLKR